MNGGLSQVDSFDPKPMLAKYDGQPMPGGDLGHERKTGTLMKSPFEFKKYGKSGIEVSELFPNVGECVDDICVIRSVFTEIPNHEPSLIMMNTGANVIGRPSMGSWLTYGLGTTTRICPASSSSARRFPPPSAHRSGAPASCPPCTRPPTSHRHHADKDFDPYKLIPNIHNERFDVTQQRQELDLIKQLDAARTCSRDSGATRSSKPRSAPWRPPIACRPKRPMSSTCARKARPRSRCTAKARTARGCLTAARLIEKGVRMVQIYYAQGDPWDHHNDILLHRKNAKDSDQPFAALIKDLKARGLFDETIIVCGSEFGRTPVVELGGAGSHNGRDHNPHGFTMWLAGGGIKGGMTYGATDDFGWKVVDKPVHVHDIHATILYLLGIDHTKLTYRYSGRDFRLTDVSGNVIHDIIA